MASLRVAILDASSLCTENTGPWWPFWRAWLDGCEERGAGTGRTEAEAVEDLMESLNG